MKKKLFYLGGCIILLLCILFVYNRCFRIKINKYDISDTLVKYKYNNNDYYVIKGDYKGVYNIKYSLFNDEESIPSGFNINDVLSFEEYKEYAKNNDIALKYFDETKNYIVVSYCRINSVSIEARVAGLEFNNDSAKLYLWENSRGVVSNSAAYTLVIPVSKDIKKLDIVTVYTEEEFENIKKYGTSYDPGSVTIDKPIIYLYPTKETNISVKLLNDNLITHSYPEYDSEWNVRANSNGDLVDLKTNRKLYALYYESKNNINFSTDDGFVIEGKDAAKFLEEKLEILGLSERESEEFIIYWLPKLENNKYNYIRFATIDEINKNMPLEINPKPETLIRVLMIYKKLDNKITIKEQELTKVNRNGYTVVEWGGTELQ